MWTAEPTPTATPTPTLFPTDTPTPTLLPADAPHPVVITIADAEREVLGWALPANEARIERSTALTVADFLASRSPETGFPAMAEVSCFGVLVDDERRILDLSTHCKSAMAPDRVIIVVEGSQRGINLDTRQDRGEGEERPTACGSVSSRSRARFLAFFDATHGYYLGTSFVDKFFDASWLDDLAQAPAARLLMIGSPTPTPTVTLTPVPRFSSTPYPTVEHPTIKPTLGLPEGATEERELQAGEVPAPLLDAAREIGEVPGSRWTYRVTTVDQGLRWSQFVMTETIHSAARIAPDVMMLQRRSCRTPGERTAAIYGIPLCSDYDRYYVLPTGRATGLTESWKASPLAALRQELAGTLVSDDISRAIIAQLRLPLEPNQEYGDMDVDWRTLGQASIDVPAGHFDGCIALNGMVGVSSAETDWTCPGVGVVRREAGTCRTMGGGQALYELLDYDIPPIVPVP